MKNLFECLKYMFAHDNDIEKHALEFLHCDGFSVFFSIINKKLSV